MHSTATPSASIRRLLLFFILFFSRIYCRMYVSTNFLQFRTIHCYSLLVQPAIFDNSICPPPWWSASTSCFRWSFLQYYLYEILNHGGLETKLNDDWFQTSNGCTGFTIHLHLQHLVEMIFVISRGEQVSKVVEEKYLCEASQLLVILDNVNVPFS